MRGASEIAELATTLIHVLSGLYSALHHVVANDSSGAIGIALVTGLCVLIVSGALALAEVVKMKVRGYVRKRELTAKSSETREERKDVD